MGRHLHYINQKARFQLQFVNLGTWNPNMKFSKWQSLLKEPRGVFSDRTLAWGPKSVALVQRAPNGSPSRFGQDSSLSPCNPLVPDSSSALDANHLVGRLRVTLPYVG